MAAEGNQTAAMAQLMTAELIPVLVASQAHQGPVIETCPPQLTVVDGKTEGLHQVQFRIRSRTGAGHIAGIGRNLGLKQDDPGHALGAKKATAGLDALSRWVRLGFGPAG